MSRPRLRIETISGGEPMAPFRVPNCLVPARFVALVEKFLVDRRTGNISLNIKDGMILGAHIEEIVVFRGRQP